MSWGIKRRKPRKKSERQKKVEKILGYVKLFAKERDGWKCVKCGRSREAGWQIHGAHILSTGKYPKSQFDPENVKALCALCHKDWHDESDGTAWLETKYPGLRDRLLARDKLAAKPDLDLLLIAWREQM